MATSGRTEPLNDADLIEAIRGLNSLQLGEVCKVVRVDFLNKQQQLGLQELQRQELLQKSDGSEHKRYMQEQRREQKQKDHASIGNGTLSTLPNSQGRTETLSGKRMWADKIDKGGKEVLRFEVKQLSSFAKRRLTILLEGWHAVKNSGNSNKLKTAEQKWLESALGREWEEKARMDFHAWKKRQLDENFPSATSTPQQRATFFFDTTKGKADLVRARKKYLFARRRAISQYTAAQHKQPKSTAPGTAALSRVGLPLPPPVAPVQNQRTHREGKSKPPSNIKTSKPSNEQREGQLPMTKAGQEHKQEIKNKVLPAVNADRIIVEIEERQRKEQQDQEKNVDRIIVEIEEEQRKEQQDQEKRREIAMESYMDEFRSVPATTLTTPKVGPAQPDKARKRGRPPKKVLPKQPGPKKKRGRPMKRN